jgi:hypothetical protein
MSNVVQHDEGHAHSCPTARPPTLTAQPGQARESLVRDQSIDEEHSVLKKLEVWLTGVE